jgi:hypothetical protein
MAKIEQVLPTELLGMILKEHVESMPSPKASEHYAGAQAERRGATCFPDFPEDFERLVLNL